MLSEDDGRMQSAAARMGQRHAAGRPRPGCGSGRRPRAGGRDPASRQVLRTQRVAVKRAPQAQGASRSPPRGPPAPSAGGNDARSHGRAQPLGVGQRHGVGDVKAPRSRAPEGRQVGAAPQRLAQVARQRPDVEPGGRGRRSAGRWSPSRPVQSSSRHGDGHRFEQRRCAILPRQVVRLAPGDLLRRMRGGHLRERAAEARQHAR